MTDVEKQESQKTVVAFITGLLIGGLLVWVFSSTPEAKEEPKDEEVTTEEVVATEEVKSEEVTAREEVVAEVIGEGALTVVDQKAGKVVALKDTKFPTKNGWVVVRELMDGMPGNVLGAARYSADEGLVPAQVELMRETTVGGTYQVVFFTNGGELKDFDFTTDTLIEGVAATFKAS